MTMPAAVRHGAGVSSAMMKATRHSLACGSGVQCRSMGYGEVAVTIVPAARAPALPRFCSSSSKSARVVSCASQMAEETVEVIETATLLEVEGNITSDVDVSGTEIEVEESYYRCVAAVLCANCCPSVPGPLWYGSCLEGGCVAHLRRKFCNSCLSCH